MRGNLASRINSQINSIGSAKMNMASRIYWTARTANDRETSPMRAFRGKAAFPSRHTVSRHLVMRAHQESVRNEILNRVFVSSAREFLFYCAVPRFFLFSFFFFFFVIGNDDGKCGIVQRRDAHVHWILSSSFRSLRLIKTTFILFLIFFFF